MSHDDVALPTNNVRRRSIFENDTVQEEKDILNFPEESEIYYPIEYFEKIRTEIELWKMHITKTLEEKQKFKAEKIELQNAVVDENILSSGQCDIIASFNFEEYIQRVEKFCDRAAIIAHKIRYKRESEVEQQYLATQNKLEKEIMMKHFINS